MEAVTLASQLRLNVFNNKINSKLVDHKAFTEWAADNFDKIEYPTQEMAAQNQKDLDKLDGKLVYHRRHLRKVTAKDLKERA